MNRDAQATGYDRRVANEAHPIRTGYAACLDWVAAQVEPGGTVLDLGSGTGNLALRLPPCRVVCVDLSAVMTRLARAKLPRGITFVQADLLAYFDEPRGPFDAIVSTYAVHNLPEEQKSLLFERVRGALAPLGRAVFGDLMFENAAERERLLAKHAHDDSVAGAIREEFFWDLETAVPRLERLGFAVEVRRFSELSWGVAARFKKG
jgi:cyclopropane fatty-acyl-phospholipid synthase-like methyltransferase